MRTSQLLLVAAAATAQANKLAERDTLQCLSIASDLLPALTDIPTPDASLVTFIATQTQVSTLTGACQIPAVTGTMADGYSSYIASATSWVNKHKKDISSILEACSDLPQFSSLLNEYPEVTSLCEKYTWISDTTTATGAASAASATGTSDSTTSAQNSDNAAPQQTGVMMAAAGVAGLAIAGLY